MSLYPYVSVYIGLNPEVLSLPSSLDMSYTLAYPQKSWHSSPVWASNYLSSRSWNLPEHKQIFNCCIILYLTRAVNFLSLTFRPRISLNHLQTEAAFRDSSHCRVPPPRKLLETCSNLFIWVPLPGATSGGGHWNCSTYGLQVGVMHPFLSLSGQRDPNSDRDTWSFLNNLDRASHRVVPLGNRQAPVKTLPCRKRFPHRNVCFFLVKTIQCAIHIDFCFFFPQCKLHPEP